jgi:hypothetical protein
VENGEARIDYEGLAASRPPTAETWDAFVRTVLVGPWLDAYDQRAPWDAAVMEITLGALTYLFDGTPTIAGWGDDRVVAVWGRSRVASSPRDPARHRRFISQAGRDHGHFVDHAAGGGMDMNLFPLAAG